MRTPTILAAFALTALCTAPAAAQACAPAAIPIGQVGLAGTAPSCVGGGLKPGPLFFGGNPGFAIAPATLAAAPAGSARYLLISGFAPPPFLPLPAGLLCGAFGPGTIPAAPLALVFAGFTPPAGLGVAPPPVPLPIPAGIPPGGLFLAVQSVWLFPGFGGCVAVSNGIAITN